MCDHYPTITPSKDTQSTQAHAAASGCEHCPGAKSDILEDCGDIDVMQTLQINSSP
jgi:hypothetical protein